MKQSFKRISKREAFRRFSAKQVVYLCPSKMCPSNPWNVACPIHPEEYLERAKWLMERDMTTHTGTIEQYAWDLMYNNWAFYNTSWECGYYAHYYIIG